PVTQVHGHPRWKPRVAGSRPFSLSQGMVMATKAMARFARISPRKARMIVNFVRGKTAAEALQLLQFTNKAGAPWVRRVLESAVANARTQNPTVDVDALYISIATVDKGPN